MFFHKRFEPVEPFFPLVAEIFDELVDLFHLHGIEVIINFPSLLLWFHQLTFGQYLKVFGYSGARRVEVRGYRSGRQGLRSQQQKDCPSGGVGNSLEYISTQIHREAIWLQIYV